MILYALVRLGCPVPCRMRDAPCSASTDRELVASFAAERLCMCHAGQARSVVTKSEHRHTENYGKLGLEFGRDKKTFAWQAA